MDIEDPRIERTKRHELIDVITIAICAVICGADSWVAIETYGQAKEKWLKRFLELPNGIPEVCWDGNRPQQLLFISRYICKNICFNQSRKIPELFFIMDKISCNFN